MTANDPFARYLRTPEAARFLGLSPRTLEKHRTYGTGPTYRKLGGRIVYAPDDPKIWADRGVRHSTTDPGSDTIHPAKRRENDLPPVVRSHTSRPTARNSNNR